MHKEKSITIVSQRRKITLPVRKILYIHMRRKHADLYMDDGKSIETRTTYKEFYDMLGDDFIEVNTSHRLYIGGYAGMNQGMISDSTVAGSRIGNEYLVSSDNVAYMSAGGFAGIDAASGSDADVRGISGVTISDTEIRSESVAGGIIGENSYALIEKASLTNVYVYGGREYAGQLAGINRSTAAAEGYCYYTNARTQTKTGKAGVIAGLCEKPEDYDGMTSIIAVRTNDNKTTVINGDEFINYSKGAFFYEFRRGKVWIQFYDIKNLAEKW